MLKNYLAVTFRNFKKQKVFMIANVTGLSLSMGICVALVMIIKLEFSYDNGSDSFKRRYCHN